MFFLCYCVSCGVFVHARGSVACWNAYTHTSQPSIPGLSRDLALFKILSRGPGNCYICPGIFIPLMINVQSIHNSCFPLCSKNEHYHIIGTCHKNYIVVKAAACFRSLVTDQRKSLDPSTVCDLLSAKINNSKSCFDSSHLLSADSSDQ